MKKLKASNKILALIIAAFMLVAATACGNANEEMLKEFEGTMDYVGIWYSGEQNARAYQLLENGMFFIYTIPLGEEPVLGESGLYMKIKGEDALSFGVSFNSTYQQTHQLGIRSDEILFDGDVEFHKITNEQDADILYSLRVMAVPMEEYAGSWENDSNFTRMTITEDAEYNIIYYEITSVGIATKGSDYLLVGMNDLRIEVTEGGGLKLEGTDGTFYPEGDERVMNGTHKTFIGFWHNETTDDAITFTEYGEYYIVDGGFNSDGNLSVGISSGKIDFNGGILTYTFNDKEYAAEINGGVMTISGIEGMFEKN